MQGRYTWLDASEEERTDKRAVSAFSVQTSRMIKRILPWLVPCVFALLLLLAFSPATSEQAGRLFSKSSQKHLVEAPQPPKRIYLRVGGQTGDGLGSAIMHFKQSIIMSLALNSTMMLTAHNVGGDSYSSSRIWNGEFDKATPVWLDTQNACQLEDRVSKEKKNELARAWCEGKEWAFEEISAIAKVMDNCTSIIDMTPDDLIEDLSGCIHGWVRERLTGPKSSSSELALSTAPTGDFVTVGVHLRWGDVAGQYRGTMHIETINRVMKDIYAKWGSRVRVSVAMEKHDLDVLARLEFPEYATSYTLLDTPDASDPMTDLRLISDNDILLIGASSYALMAHMIAPPGLTVLDSDWQNKFVNTSAYGRPIVEMKDYSFESLEILDELWA